MRCLDSPLQVHPGVGLSQTWSEGAKAVGAANARSFVGAIEYELPCSADVKVAGKGGDEGEEETKGDEAEEEAQEEEDRVEEEEAQQQKQQEQQQPAPQAKPAAKPTAPSAKASAAASSRRPPAAPVTVAALALADAKILIGNAWSLSASNATFVAVHGANVRVEGLGSQITARLSCMLQAQASGDGLRYAHAPFSAFSKLDLYPELSGAEAFVNLGAGEVQIPELQAMGFPDHRVLDGIPPFNDPARVPGSPPTCFGFLAAHTALAQLLRPQLRARLFQGKPQRRRAYFSEAAIRVVVHVKRPEDAAGGKGRGRTARDDNAGGAVGEARDAGQWDRGWAGGAEGGWGAEGGGAGGRRLLPGGEQGQGGAARRLSWWRSSPSPPSDAGAPAPAIASALRAVLAAARSNLRDCKVVVHSEGSAMRPDLEEIRAAAPAAEFVLGGNALDAWLDMVNADVLLADRSLFSFSAGLYSEGVVVYQPFAFSGRGLRDWFSAEEAGDGGAKSRLAERVEAAVAQRLVMDAARDAFSAAGKPSAPVNAAAADGAKKKEEDGDEK